MITAYRRSLVLGLAFSLSACLPPPKETPRQAVLSEASVGLTSTPSPAIADGWWKSFGDPQLDRLVDQALQHDPSLAEAEARMREAQAMSDSARAGLLPSIGFAAGETRTRYSATDIIPPPYGGGTFWEGSSGLQLSWDLDFWGRQAALVEQARSASAAASLDAAGARLALAGALAQAYIDLYRNYALADLATTAEQQRSHILDITRQRVNAGLDTRVELREAEGQVPLTRVELTQAQAARALAVHQLAALAGQGAEAYAAVERPQLQIDAALPLPQALPADLLGHRPDVLAARLRVEAATAGQHAARQAFYPDVSLSALAGYSAFGISDLFEAASRTYGGGPAIHLPLFESQSLKAGLRGASAALDDAIAAYNQTVLQAVRQVSDQLSLIDALNYEIGQQQKSLDAAEDAYRIADERYAAGLASYLSVLNAQTQVIDARRQQVNLVAQHAIARITLLLALGGSFDPNAPVPVQFADGDAVIATTSKSAEFTAGEQAHE